MNIYVLVKQVPVISDIKINHQTFSIERDGAGTMMNPVDIHAVSAAVALKKSLGGTITVLTMGNETSEVPGRRGRSVAISSNGRPEAASSSSKRSRAQEENLAGSASRAAAPKPTMPGTFNVPERRPRCWPPP